MIEDLDGATVEPARRRHVVALSGAVAAVSLALLVALVVPPSGGSVAEAPSAAPSAGEAPTLTLVSESAGFAASSGRVMLDQVPSQLESRLVCAAPRPDVWSPTFVVDGVSYAVGERAGRALPPPALVAASSSGWLALQIYDGSGRQLLYTCVQSDALAPRIDLSTIPR